ncbi:MAG: alpha-galactosidase, partial [Victivallales bacterium]|nr:alpha-galactosidase [Victivallales bacterium]
FADKVRQAGLGFGFWVEFEFFSSRSRIVQEKPHWFFNSEHPDIVVPRTWIPEVEEMLVQSFAEVIRRYKAVFIKNDMNHSQGYDPAHLYRYQQGVARIMGRLREMFPEVTFEHCASGAMRHAAGPMLDAFDTHFISDNAAPLDCLRIAANQALRFPVGRISRWYVGSELHHANEASQSERRIVQPQLATWNTYQAEDLHFGLLSNLTGILGFSCDLASFSPENRRIMAEYTAFYKSIRQHCAQAEMHMLTAPECFDKRRGWLAMQITLPTIDTHLCYAFHYVADGDERRFFHLKELDAAGKYTVSTIFPERKLLASEVTGRELMNKGLEVCFSYDQQLSAFKGQLIRILKTTFFEKRCVFQQNRFAIRKNAVIVSPADGKSSKTIF